MDNVPEIKIISLDLDPESMEALEELYDSQQKMSNPAFAVRYLESLNTSYKNKYSVKVPLDTTSKANFLAQEAKNLGVHVVGIGRDIKNTVIEISGSLGAIAVLLFVVSAATNNIDAIGPKIKGLPKQAVKLLSDGVKLLTGSQKAKILTQKGIGKAAKYIKNHPTKTLYGALAVGGAKYAYDRSKQIKDELNARNDKYMLSQKYDLTGNNPF